MKLENLVVRPQFPFLDLPARHPAFVERPLEEASSKAAALPPIDQSREPVVESPIPEGLIHAQELPVSSPIAQQPFFQ